MVLCDTAFLQNCYRTMIIIYKYNKLFLYFLGYKNNYIANTFSL